MYILERINDETFGDTFRLSDGALVYVNAWTVGYVGGHPSNVDYYRDAERGYGCESNREIALVYHTMNIAARS